MSVVINTNVDSIKIQNLLNSSTNKLSQSMQRLSSGLKINSAKDDAAGTVISERMAVQLDGNQICQNNVQNGDAMLATAEGNIDVVLDNISRIRDLTLQAKNGTYSTEEIQAMQDEVAERIAEIDRVSENSKYSQLKLFEDEDLQTDGVTFQVGANSSEDNTIKADASLFKSVKFNSITGRDGKTILGYTVNKPEVGATYTKLKTQDDDDADINYVKISKEDAFTEDGKLEANVTAVCLVTADEDENTKIGSVDGDIIYLKKVDSDSLDGQTKFEIGDDETYATVKTAGQEADKITATGLDLSTLSKDDMAVAIDNLDSAIDNLTSRKSLIGSAQNRLESALDTLTTQYTNLSSAKSIITDADIASEASNYTQQQILQQISTSLLTQANQTPSIALSLL